MDGRDPDLIGYLQIKHNTDFVTFFIFECCHTKKSCSVELRYLPRDLWFHSLVRLTRMLQGPYGSLDRDRPLIRLPFTSFAVGTVLLPLTGLIACLFISLVYHFEDATYTHCQVGGVMQQQ